jgi:hypothetical protein
MNLANITKKSILKLPLTFLLVVIFTFGFSIYRAFLPGCLSNNGTQHSFSLRIQNVNHVKTFPSLRQLVLDFKHLKKRAIVQPRSQNTISSHLVFSCNTTFKGGNRVFQDRYFQVPEDRTALLSRYCFFLI